MLTIYGADWCEDTQRSLRYLRRIGVEHLYRNVDEDAAALDEAKALNHGKRRTPVVQVNGEVLVEPGTRALGEALVRNGIIDRRIASERLSRQNVGDLERGIRIGAGAGLALLALKAPRALKIPLVALGVWEALTGATGSCPVYRALGVTSLGGPLDHPMETDRDKWLARTDKLTVAEAER